MFNLNEALPTKELALCELFQYRNIYVDSKNKVHVLIPISASKDGIATDNTCQSVEELRVFYGANAHEANSKAGIAVVQAYISHLEADLKLLEGRSDLKELANGKYERLVQLKNYLQLLPSLDTDDVRKALFTNKYGEFPQPVLNALNDPKVNCVGARFSPYSQDNYFRVVDPLFNPERRFSNDSADESKGYFGSFVYSLRESLNKESGFFKITSTKEKIWEKVSKLYKSDSNVPQKPIDLNRLRECLQKVFKELEYQGNIEFCTQANKPIDLDYIEMLDLDIESISDCCDVLVPDYIKDNFISELPFSNPLVDISKIDELGALDQFTIRTQFLLAIANAVLYRKNGEKFNLSTLVDKYKGKLVEAILQAIKITTDNPNENFGAIQDAILECLNNSILPKDKINYKLTSVELNEIKHLFKMLFNSVKSAKEFDEFLILLLTKKGDFYYHQNRICLHAAVFAKHLANSKTEAFFQGNNALATEIALDDLNAAEPARLRFNNPAVVSNKKIVVVDFTALEPEILVQTLIANNDGKPLFESLSPDEVKKIGGHKNWEAIKKKVFEILSTGQLEAFANKFELGSALLITKEMEQKIINYYGLTNSQTVLVDLSRLEKFQKIFAALEIKGKFSFFSNQEGGVVVNIIGDNPEKSIQDVKDIVHLTENVLHITPRMAASFYQQAVAANVIFNPPANNSVFTNQGSEIVQTLKALFPDITIKAEEDIKLTLGQPLFNKHALFAGSSYKPSPDELLVGFNHHHGFVVRATADTLRRIRQQYANNCSFNLSPGHAKQLFELAKKANDSLKSLELNADNLQLALDALGILYYSVQQNHEGFRIGCETIYRKRLALLLPDLLADSNFFAPLAKEEKILDPLPFQRHIVKAENADVNLSETQWLVKESSTPGMITGCIGKVWEAAKPYQAMRIRFELNGLFDESNKVSSRYLYATADILGDFYQESLINFINKTYSLEGKILRLPPERIVTNSNPGLYANNSDIKESKTHTSFFPPQDQARSQLCHLKQIYPYESSIIIEILCGEGKEKKENEEFIQKVIDNEYKEALSQPKSAPHQIAPKPAMSRIRNLCKLVEFLVANPYMQTRLNDCGIRGYLQKKTFTLEEPDAVLCCPEGKLDWQLFPLFNENILIKNELELYGQHAVNAFTWFVKNYSWENGSIKDFNAKAVQLKSTLLSKLLKPTKTARSDNNNIDESHDKLKKLVEKEQLEKLKQQLVVSQVTVTKLTEAMVRKTEALDQKSKQLQEEASQHSKRQADSLESIKALEQKISHFEENIQKQAKSILAKEQQYLIEPRQDRLLIDVDADTKSVKELETKIAQLNLTVTDLSKQLKEKETTIKELKAEDTYISKMKQLLVKIQADIVENKTQWELPLLGGINVCLSKNDKNDKNEKDVNARVTTTANDILEAIAIYKKIISPSAEQIKKCLQEIKMIADKGTKRGEPYRFFLRQNESSRTRYSGYIAEIDDVINSNSINKLVLVP